MSSYAVAVLVTGAALLALGLVRVPSWLGALTYVAVVVAMAWLTTALRRAQRGAEERQHQLERAAHERQRAEDAVRSQDALLRVIIDALPGLVSYVDTDGRYVLVNRPYETWFGEPREALVGRRIEDVVGETHMATIRPYLERAFRGEEVSYEVEARYRQGTRWIRVTLVPHRDMMGAVVGVVTSLHDISSRKAAEEEVRRLNHELALRVGELQAVLDTAPVGIGVAADPDCTDIAANPTLSRMLGLDPGANASLSGPDADRLPFVALRDGEPIPADELPMQRAARLGIAIEGEQLQIRRLDGTTLTLFGSATPLRAAGGGVRGCVGIFVDVTSLKAAEEALREGDRRKDEFLGMLAHELRNPLGPIRNAVQVLRRMGPDEPERVQARDMIDRQVAHMVRLIDDLLDVSRITRGKIELQRDAVDLATIVAQAVDTVRTAVDAKRLRLVVDATAERLPLYADPTRLTQVVTNLLTNAAKFTEPGGTIRVTTRRRGDDAVLRVADTGVGIAPAMLPQVFEMFVQADTSMDRAAGGLGIGLTLARSLVTLHGGRLSATSDGPGRGSTFEVALPIVEAAPAPGVEGTPAPGTSARPQRALRILLVEDNVDTAESFKTLLELDGHVVDVVGDGLAAPGAAARLRPDVAFVDIGLPGLDGYEVARRMRELAALDGTLLVAVSGYGRDEDKRRAAEAGFDHHFTKPVALERVAALLATLSARG